MRTGILSLLVIGLVGCPPPSATGPARRTVGKRTPPRGPVVRDPGATRPLEAPATYKAYFTVFRGAKQVGRAYLGYEKNENGSRFELRQAVTMTWGRVTHHVTLQTDDKLNPKKMRALEMEQIAGTTLRMYAQHDVTVSGSGVAVTTTKFGRRWKRQFAVSSALPTLRYPLLTAYLLARRQGKGQGGSVEYTVINPVTGATRTMEMSGAVKNDEATYKLDFGTSGRLDVVYDVAWAKLLGATGTGRVFTYRAGSKAPALVPPPASFKRVVEVTPFSWPRSIATKTMTFKAKDGLLLRGVISWPAAKGRLPLVVLVPSAAAQDMNGTNGLRQTYAQLAALLTQAGYAVFRFAPRGVMPTGGDVAKARLGQLVSDLRAVIWGLRGNRRINKRKMFLLGHAEGGLVALTYANKRGYDLRGLVLASTPGVDYSDYFLDQFRRRWETFGMPVSVVNKRINWLKSRLQAAISGSQKMFFGRPGALVADLSKIDPLKAYGKVRIPTLILVGDADVTVRSDDVNALRAGMAKNRRITVSRPKNVGHALQHSPGFMEVSEMWKVPGPIAKPVREALLNWLKKTR